MRTYEAADMNELHTKMCLDIMRAPRTALSVTSNVDVAIENVMAQADSMVWDFDLKSLWLSKSRWSMMVRQYLDADDVRIWLGQCTGKIGRKGRGQAVLRTKTVKPRGGAATGHTNMQTRRWGSCMLSVSYRALPKPTITLHSRTSYLGYLSALDFTIAHVLGQYVAAALGLEMNDIRFVWMVEAVQWHGFKSLPYAICNTDDRIRKQYRRLLFKKLGDLSTESVGNELSEYDLATTPAMMVTRRWVNYVRKEDQAGMTLGDTNYNTYRRVRRRWHTEVLGIEKAKTFEGWSYYVKGPKEGEQREFFKAYQPLPNVWTSTLDLEAIKLPPADSWWVTQPEQLEIFEPDSDNEDDVCLICGEFD